MNNVAYKNNPITIFQIILIFSYLLLFYIFGANAANVKYSELILLLFLATESINIWKYKTVSIDKIIIIVFFFSLFCLLSAFWAVDSNAALSKGITLISLSFFLLFSYNFFKRINNGEEVLLKIIMYSGIVFSFYVIMYYGFNNYFDMLSNGMRIGEEINNVNTLGLQVSISAMICIFYGLFKNKIYYFLSIIPIIVSLGTGSRKVLILLVIGSLLLIILKNNSKEGIKNVIKKIIGISIIVLLFLYISNLPMFSTIFKRMNMTINSYTGSGKVDKSTIERKLFIDAGLEQFYLTPIGGIGAGNSYIITQKVAGWETYLHNNFVELLATLGIIGFVLYYYIFLNLILRCLRNIKNKYLIVSMIILLLNVILDYGSVSYYNKNTYVYILFALIATSNNNLKVSVDKNENKENNL